jgi:acetyltransferase-like isoleucine patch superfamily enzyme
MKQIIKILFEPELLVYYIYRLKLNKKYKNKNIIIGLKSTLTNVNIGDNLYISDNCSIRNSKIGSNTYLNRNVQVLNCEIGKYCSIGTDVKLGMGKHPTNMVSTHPTFYANNKPYSTYADDMYFNEYTNIVIGNDVWIGSNVIILGEVSISNGAIIAAGSIVTKDIPPYAIAGGIPAKIIKYRFSEDIIDELQKIQWWNFSEDWLKKNYKLLHNPENFINYYHLNSNTIK